jgi:homeodomain interacting protein kinase
LPTDIREASSRIKPAHLHRNVPTNPTAPFQLPISRHQERRITPGEALNHAFVTLAHLVDYAHCNNVKASVQMMEVCRRNSYNGNNSNGHHQPAPQVPPLVANFVPTSNGNVTLTFNNQLTNQVQRLVRERANGFDNLVRYTLIIIVSLS